MTGNKEITNIYDDPTNKDLCEEIRAFLDKSFLQIKMKSKVDYRSKENVNHNFFFINKNNSHNSQNELRKQIAITSIPRELILKRKGYSFSISDFYGNLIDVNFFQLLKKKLIFQDFLLIAKKVNFLILRNIHQLDDEHRDLVYKFILLVDAFYENKNILSISTTVELNNIYVGKSWAFEFKRTISRLKEMGSNTYINKNLQKFIKK